MNFSLRDILTVTTGRLLTKRVSDEDNGISALYIILEHITGVPPYTHTLGVQAKQATPVILQLYPQLDTVNVERLDTLIAYKDTEEAVCLWLDEEVAKGLQPEYDIPNNIVTLT